MIIPVEAIPKTIFIATTVAELFLVAIPLILILAYRQKHTMPTRSLWLGMGLSIVTCIKFLFLMKQQLFANFEPFYSISIIVLVEAIVREGLVRRWDKWANPFVAIQFVMGYLFAKLLGIGTSVFLFFAWMLARLSYQGGQGAINPEAFQQLTPYTQLCLHSLFNLGYMILLFAFIVLRLRMVDRPRWSIALTEIFFLLSQGFFLLVINQPTLPTVPSFVIVGVSTLGLGYFAYLSIREPETKHN